MQTPLRSAIALAALGGLALAARPAGAAPERSLLGIRLWNPASSVLSRFHQPTRIESAKDQGVTTDMSRYMGAPAMPGAPGVSSGPGLPGLPGLGMPTGPGSQLSEGGSSATAMMQTYRSAMGAGIGAPAGMYGGTSAPMGGPPPGVMGGAAGMGRSAYGGPPMGGSPYGGPPPGVMGGGYPGMGPGGMPGSPGMAGAPAEAPGLQGLEEGETQWIYQLKNGNTLIFLLNSENRVIQITSLGYKNGGATARGIKLGDSLARVYHAYGTNSRVDNSPSGVMTLDYTKNYHCAFQLYNRGKGFQVIGITVAATER